MDKIESNAIRIAELKGFTEVTPWKLKSANGVEYNKSDVLSYGKTYDGLMQIIESEISEYELKHIHFELKTDSLLEAVQNFVIRYLELKNGL